MEKANILIVSIVILSFWTCICSGAKIDRKNPSDPSIEINQTFDLLKEGEKKIILSDRHKNVTLLLGLTGSGKSTLMQWLAGDNDKLMSVMQEDGEYIIEDGYRIGSSTKSKTIFPELVVDNETNSAYYDCPGFSDTRSTSHDIATTYFIKKLTDHAERVKIVFAVSHPSVKRGMNRLSFQKLVEHATELIPNIAKFRDSIALVATKVDKPSNEPKNIKKGIANFLKEFKEGMEEELDQPDISESKKKNNENAINFVKILLTQNENGDYEKIGLFRIPNAEGPLSKIELLVDAKQSIKEMLNQNLKFSMKANDDFGYTVSDKSKHIIGSLVEKINDLVWIEMREIARKLQLHFENSTFQITEAVNFDANTGELKNEVSITDGRSLAENFARTVSTLLILVDKIQLAANIEEIVIQIQDTTSKLNIDSCAQELYNISGHLKFLKFLQTVSKQKFTMKNFFDLFEPLKSSANVTQESIRKDAANSATRVHGEMEKEITDIENHIEITYSEKIDTISVENLLVVLGKDYHMSLDFAQELMSSNTKAEVSESFRKCVEKMNISNHEINHSLTKMTKYEKSLKQLQIFNSDKSLTQPTSSAAGHITKTIKLISESYKWFEFLRNLYLKFSDYDIQKHIKKHNLVPIEYVGNLEAIRNMEITKENFPQFLELLDEYNIDYKSAKKINASEIQLKKLNQVLKLTIHNMVEPECLKSGELTLKGNYIKFSEFSDNDGNLANLCLNKLNITVVNIYALHTVFIDRDFYGVGKKTQLNIVAPKWVIIGSRKIILDGRPGSDRDPSKASKGNCEGCNGFEGEPGLPGGAAGDFIGIVQEACDMKNLIISVNGGNGGRGQEGGDGVEGTKGEKGNYDSGCMSTGSVIAVVANDNSYWCPGYPGGRGGKGGVGGAGGLAGQSGTVNMNLLGEKSDFTVVKDRAVVGNDGKGGKGGLGGRMGDAYTYTRRNDFFTLFVPVISLWGYEVSKERTQGGLNGNDGENTYKRQKPEKKIDPLDISHIIESFKDHLGAKSTNSGKTFIDNSLHEFNDLMDSKIARLNDE